MQILPTMQDVQQNPEAEPAESVLGYCGAAIGVHYLCYTVL
jgi:hypothetical protein